MTKQPTVKQLIARSYRSLIFKTYYLLQMIAEYCSFWKLKMAQRWKNTS